MTNFEMTQKFGKEVLEQLAVGGKVDILILGMMQNIMELIAAIADKMGIPNDLGKNEKEDE